MAVFIFFGSLLGIVLTMHSWQKKKKKYVSTYHVLLTEVGTGANIWLCLSSLGLYSALCSPCTPGRGGYWNKRMVVLLFFGSLLGIVLTMYSWQKLVLEQMYGCVYLLWGFARHCAHHVLLAEVGTGANVWLCSSSIGLYSVLCSPCTPGRGRYWNKHMAVLLFFGSLLGIVLTRYSWQRWVLKQTYGCIYLLWALLSIVLTMYSWQK